MGQSSVGAVTNLTSLLSGESCVRLAQAVKCPLGYAALSAGTI